MALCRIVPLIAVLALSIVSNGHGQNKPAMGDHKQTKVPKKYKKLSRSIGLLQNRRGGFCTAFCLRRNVIGTAAHCVNSEDKKFRPSNISFRLSGSKRVSSVSGGNRQANRLSTIVGSNRESRHNDWALVRLSKPICQGLELATANLPPDGLYNTKNVVISIFYHPGRKRPLLRFSNCDVDQKMGVSWRNRSGRLPFPDDLVLHNCDVKPGSSGAPLIWVNGDKPRVVAIQSGWTEHLGHTDAHVAVHVRTVLPYLDGMASRKKITSDKTIRQIQRLLKATGDYKSSVDGNYGRGTRQAIVDYTRRNSLPIMTDKPISELVPIIEMYQTPAPGDELLRSLVMHINNPDEGYRHKAIAVNFERDAWAVGSDMDQKDAKVAAIKMCVSQLTRKRMLGPAKDRCDLYAVDGEIVLNKADPNLETIAKFLDRLEASGPKIRMQISEYRNRRGVDYKAAAIGGGGAKLYGCEQQSTIDSAIECAMDDCNSAEDNCALFALGDKAVFGMDKSELAILSAYYEAIIGSPGEL